MFRAPDFTAALPTGTLIGYLHKDGNSHVPVISPKLILFRPEHSNALLLEAEIGVVVVNGKQVLV